MLLIMVYNDNYICSLKKSDKHKKVQNEESKAMKPSKAGFQNSGWSSGLQVSVSLLIKPRCDGANPQSLNSQRWAHEYA